jgi:hypothetical protein
MRTGRDLVIASHAEGSAAFSVRIRDNLRLESLRWYYEFASSVPLVISGFLKSADECPEASWVEPPEEPSVFAKE